MKTYRLQILVFVILTIVALLFAGCGGGGGGGGGGGEATLVSIEVTPEFASIAKGATQQFTATGVYSDNTNRDITTSVTWSSEDTTVATVNSSGLATGVSTGSTFIIASLGDIYGNLALLTVTAYSVPSPPTNVTATAGDGQVAISWSAVSGAASYNIYWSQATGVSKTTGTKISNVTNPSYMHAGLTNGTTYYYVVTAVNTYGESSESIQVSAMPSAALAAGSLDITFGAGGIVTTAVGSRDESASAIVIQGDGKIVAAGYVYQSIDGSTWYPDFALVRYNADGSLDSTFGSGGKATTAVGTGSNINALAIQGGGKIVAAGSAIVNSMNVFALVRYNADGSLDSTFGSGGKATTAVGTSSYISALAIQGDGKIVVAGSSWNGSNDDFALARYNQDGSLDTTFGSGGKVTTGVGTAGSGFDQANAVAIQSDGKIVAAGEAIVRQSGSAFPTDFALVRYNIDGSLDSTFGSSGKVTTAIGTGSANSESLAIQGDGKIVAVGNSWNGTDLDFALARYNVDGSLDSTFGSGGKVTTAVGSGDDLAHGLAIQGDGKIVVAGVSWNGSNYSYDFALVRYNIDGNMDMSFGTGGKVTTAVGNGDDNASDMAIQGDGKIVAAGRSWNGSNDDFALVRYLP